MEELEKFIDFLYENQTGFVYSPYAKRDEKGNVVDWVNEFFSWPNERTALLDHIKLNGTESDVYISPAVFSKKSSKKDSFKSSRVVWVEFDGKETIDFKDVPKPDAIVQTSSSTHIHCYWKTDLITQFQTVDEVNRRLTYYFKADGSGWDAGQLLRPPSSKNIKRGGIPVLLSYFNEKPSNFSLQRFDVAPAVETPYVELTEAQLLDPSKVIPQLPILKSLRNKIEKEIPVGPTDGQPGYRSQFMFKVAHELAEAGCNHAQIATVIAYIDDRIGKFTGRSDRLARISEIASLALHSVNAEEQISLYTPNDVLNHTEDLEWIYEKWLHNQGLLVVSGAPGVGKTQFCLNLGHAFSVGKEFLTSKLQQRDVLFMSLEMDVRELKIILRKQYEDYGNMAEWSKHMRFSDEQGTFLQYEELIESFNPGVVIIDSMLELSNGEMKEGSEVIQVTRWLKRMRKKYDCAIVLIHHNRKGSGSNKKPNRLEDLFGSVVLNKEIDTAFVLWQEEQSDPIDLLVVKSRFSQREDSVIERTEHLTFRHRTPSGNSDTGQPTKASTSFNFGFAPGSS